MISGEPPVERVQIGIPGWPQEAIIYKGRIYIYNTVGQSLVDGGFIAARAIAAQAIIAEKVRVCTKQFIQNITWTSTTYNKASWGNGTIQWSDGTTSTIYADNTGEISQLTFVYYNGSSILSVTTNYKNTVGNNKVLLAAISPDTDILGNCLITTFLSTGTTIEGNKVVTGKIQSADGKTYFDLDEGRILISDDNNSRVLIGKLGNFYGAKISRTGYNITENDYRLLAFISNQYGNILKVKQQGTFTVTIADGETSGYTEVSHDLGYFPGAYAFVETSTGKKLRCNFVSGYQTNTDAYTGRLKTTFERLRVTMSRSGSSGAVNFTVYYYLFIDDTNIQ